MKRHIVLTIVTTCLFLCGFFTAYAQEGISLNDIRGIWVSSLLYNEFTGEYELMPTENAFSLGFTGGKGKLNNLRHTGLYRKISEGRPKLLYYSLESNKVQFYDSSDTPLSYFLVIEALIPNVSMTATLIHKEGTNTLSTKIKFLYFEKKNN
jgi:hypothetical protein